MSQGKKDTQKKGEITNKGGGFQPYVSSPELTTPHIFADGLVGSTTNFRLLCAIVFREDIDKSQEF